MDTSQQNRPRHISLREIEAGKSPAGGWTKAQLAAWGVPWPPPKGWKRRLALERKPVRAIVGGHWRAKHHTRRWTTDAEFRMVVEAMAKRR